MNEALEAMKMIRPNKKGSGQKSRGEETYLLQGDAVYVPYRLLSGLPFGKTWKDAPEGAESILFEFGDTSTMEVWDTPIENSSMGYTKGLCIRYCNQDGKIYQFDVENVTCDDLKKALR